MKRIISVLILLSVFFAGCNIETLEFETIEKGEYSHGHPEQKNYVIENLNDWKYLWNKTNEGTYPSPELPIIDFNSEMIIGVYMGQKSSGGYSIEIEKITIKKDKVKVFVNKYSPGIYSETTSALTQPYHIVKIEKTDKEIVFVDN